MPGQTNSSMQLVERERERVTVTCIFLFTVLSFPFCFSSAQTNSSKLVTEKRERLMVPCIFFLTVLSLPSLFSTAQTNSSAQLDSVDYPITWCNNNSTNEIIDYGNGYLARLILRTDSYYPHFACAFICTGTCDSYFLAVLVLGKFNINTVDGQGGFPGLVWLANREIPIRENGLLQLTSTGDLVLQDSDGTNVWSTGTNGKSVLGLTLEETGNLQLYDEKNCTVWQSFDFPTDTLLPGQKLYEGQRLTASASTSNWSSGQYHAEMTSTGFAAFVKADSLLMYFKLDQESAWLRPNASHEPLQRGCSARLNCGEQHVGWNVCGRRPDNHAQLDGQNLILTIQGTNYTFVVSPHSAAGSYSYLKLGSGGHLKLYIWQENYSPREVFDLVAQSFDYCQYPHYCGDYGVCSSSAKCSCPKALDGLEYFMPISRQFPSHGCSEITTLSCQSPLGQHRLEDFGNYSYFNFIDSDAADSKMKDLEGCKQACLQECSCKAAFFVYVDNASYGSCYLPSKILSMRERPLPNTDSISFAFIKVQIPDLVPSHQPLLISPSEIKLASGMAPSEGQPRVAPSKVTHLAQPALVGVVGVFMLFVLCNVILFTRAEMRKEREDKKKVFFEQVVGMPKKFSYEELCVGTKDFEQKLGGGGFGSVFKGTLQDGMRVAVKRLDKIGQGMKEFLAEVETIGKIHHLNLVRLIGFCAEKSHRLLVYEYMSNGSLDNWIFGKDENLTIDWQVRKNITLDVAKGLTYLHEECRQRILHLDIKPQNILLDENFNAKVSDFGLSKLIDREQSQVHTTLRGTPGYLAPEWQQLIITFKADIYSFGILVLEIVCGRKNLDRSRSESSKHLLRLLQEKAEKNRLIEIVDGLREDIRFHRDEVLKMIKVAAWCLQDDPTRRPLMSTVVKVLEGTVDVEPNISFRFHNAMAHSPSTGANFHVLSDLPQASVLSGPR